VPTTLLLLTALLAPAAPRIGSQPTRVCAQALKAIFQVENPGETRVSVTLSVEHWSTGGDAEEWTIVQRDITQKEALADKARPVRVDAKRRRNVEWDLKDRKGPPPMTTGRHRLVVAYFDEKGEHQGQVLHDFVISDCSY
jgi:hypothetical protein